jgi:hypothetical protein
MPQFAPDQCTFNDIPGYGYWDIAHYREHVQFVQVLATQTPPISLFDYDFMRMLTAGGDRRSILESHNVAHSLLLQICGFTGTDYSAYDLSKSDDFYSFVGYHATDHAQIRNFLGIV